MDAIVQFIKNMDGYISLTGFFTDHDRLNVISFIILGMVTGALGLGILVVTGWREQPAARRTLLTGSLLLVSGLLSTLLTGHSSRWTNRMAGSWNAGIYNEIQAGRASYMFILAGLGLIIASCLLIPGFVILYRGSTNSGAPNYSARMLVGFGLLLLNFPLLMSVAAAQQHERTTFGGQILTEIPTLLPALLQFVGAAFLLSCLWSLGVQCVEKRQNMRDLLKAEAPAVMKPVRSNSEDAAVQRARKQLGNN